MSWTSWLDRVRDRLADTFHPLGRLANKIPRDDDPVRIMPFLGYGTAERLMLGGRVLEAQGSPVSEADDSPLENLVAAFRRFETDEVKGALVRARLAENFWEQATDGEGHFEFDLQPPGGVKSDDLWCPVGLELPAPPTPGEVRATGEVLIPPVSARFGVISDIDDTVLQTNVANKFRVVLAAVLENAHTRLPFEGVAALYQALHEGAGGGERNPVFYVSSSPWNLYDPLVEFLDVHKIPKGPILLRDYGLRMLRTLRDHHAHKLGKIKPILDLYPGLKFILVGDSGEQDPEIYSRVVSAYPGRVAAVYIRTVGLSPARESELAEIAREVERNGSEFVAAADSAAAALHAAERGWIAESAVEKVRESKKEDQQSPSPAEVVRKQERA
jgi:phosphatidate phosphatase APP1